MRRPYASVSHVRRWLSLSLTLIAGSACERAPDCTLYGTCAGSLLTRADEFAGPKKQQTCRQCLSNFCAAEEQRCSTNIKCNFTSRCMLTKSPLAYQQCLRALYEGGLTFGNERRYPWEGREVELDAGDLPTFGECLHEHCHDDCIEDPFACATVAQDDEMYMEYDVRLKVAVRSYPDYNRLQKVSIQACRDLHDGSKPVCWPAATTDVHGVANLEVRRHIKADSLYFEITEAKGDYPRTLYYPGRLGDDGLQLVPVYLVRSDTIELGNQALRREHSVLKDVAQSLILTDSCVWEKISVRDLRVSVEGASVPQCHDLDSGPCTADADCPPCIWYARNELPDFGADKTDGTGAGIVGLDAGYYTIQVKRADGGRVGGRTVRMEKGAMTILRTWPPVDEEPSSSAEP